MQSASFAAASRIGAEFDLRALGPMDHFRIGSKLARRRHAQGEAEPLGGMHPGGEHIVAVAAPGHGGALDGAAMFLEGHHIRHHLGGMAPFGQPVDDRNGGVGGQFLHHLVIQKADHDGIDIARDHPRRVGDGFLARQLHLVAGQHQGGAAQLAHRHIEGDAGAGGLLVEDHRQHAAGQRRVGIGDALGPSGARGLARLGVVDDAAQGGAVVIGQIEKMLRSRSSMGAFIARPPFVSSAAAALPSNSSPRGLRIPTR